MQSLGRVLAETSTGRAPWDDYWYQPRMTSPVAATADTVLGIPAFYAGVTMVGEDLGKVPLQMFEDLGDRGRQRAANHPLDELLSEQPNDHQTAIEFREMLVGFAYLRARAVCEIVPGDRGPVDQIIPLHPSLVRREWTQAGGLRYLYRDPKLRGQERTLLPDEVFVVTARQGLSVVDVLRENLGLALSSQRAQSFMFSRGALFAGVLTHPKTASDTVRDGLRAALDQRQIDAEKAGRPLLLEEGMTWQNVSFTNRDAQFVEQINLGIRDVSRALRIPPSKLGDLERATFSNIEQLSIDYVTDSLLGWCVRIEQAVRRDLIVAKGRYYARHNLDSLLRGDSAARAAAYSLAIMWGWMTRNEVRAKENMNPIPGLDDILTPSNMSVGEGGQATFGAALESANPAMVRGYLRLLASDAASRVVNRELAAVARIAGRTEVGDHAALRKGLTEFYAEHAEHVTEALHIPKHEARQYAIGQRDALLSGTPPNMDDWSVTRVAQLTDLAMTQAGVPARSAA